MNAQLCGECCFSAKYVSENGESLESKQMNPVGKEMPTVFGNLVSGVHEGERLERQAVAELKFVCSNITFCHAGSHCNRFVYAWIGSSFFSSDVSQMQLLM